MDGQVGVVHAARSGGEVDNGECFVNAGARAFVIQAGSYKGRVM